MTKSASPLIIVPARGGSKRLPGKNSLPLGGVPLVGWTLAACRAAGFASPLLSTDDPGLAELGRTLGFHVPFLRPARFAEDKTSSVDVVLHALDWCRETHGTEPELVVLLQPTSPFRPAGLIRDGLALIERDATTDAVIAVSRIHVPLGYVFRADEGLLEHVAAGSGEAGFIPSGALYVIKSRALREARSFIPRRTRCIEHGGIGTLDIDTPDDWTIAAAAVAAGVAALPVTGAVKQAS